MSVTDDHSYFSRFLLKFVEIVAAGLATAVSGYLIAHLSGSWSSSAPAPAAAVIQAVPTTSVFVPSQPIPSISANGDEPRLAPSEVDTPRLALPARKTLNPAKAEPPRKHGESATNAAESRRDRESFVARIQAALASANANRADALSASSPYGSGTPAIAQPGPITDPFGAAAAATATHGAGEVASPPVQEFAPNPVMAIDVNSSPVQSLPAPATAKESGMLSPLEQILRHDPLAGTEEAPRPPMPVGQ